ncbi:hypothetical protein MLGJGCBP_03096 [Rhodococcus sp. T7]|nr:hypothetical protein MLGJGCBP_03096 [Rhodococcus sp. T7]
MPPERRNREVVRAETGKLNTTSSWPVRRDRNAATAATAAVANVAPGSRSVRFCSAAVVAADSGALLTSDCAPISAARPARLIVGGRSRLRSAQYLRSVSNRLEVR